MFIKELESYKNKLENCEMLLSNVCRTGNVFVFRDGAFCYGKRQTVHNEALLSGHKNITLEGTRYNIETLKEGGYTVYYLMPLPESQPETNAEEIALLQKDIVQKADGIIDRISATKEQVQLDESNKTLSELDENIHSLEDTLGDSLHKSEEIEQRSHDFSTFIEKVKDIADKSNILALNASIEAARVGSSGAGFAIVAEEIKRLSDQTKRSILEVEMVFRTLQQDSDEILRYIGTVQEGFAELKSQRDEVESLIQNEFDEKMESFFLTLKEAVKDLYELNYFKEEKHK